MRFQVVLSRGEQLVVFYFFSLLVCERRGMEVRSLMRWIYGSRVIVGGVLCIIYYRKRRREGLFMFGFCGQGQFIFMEEQFYKGFLNWFLDRCCRMEGLELAVFFSFFQIICGEGRDISGAFILSLFIGLFIYFVLQFFKSVYVFRFTGLGREIGRMRFGDIQIKFVCLFLLLCLLF